MYILNYIRDNYSIVNILTFLAFIFAYLAYAKSIEDKYDSRRSLLKSFLDEINTMQVWLGNEYKDNDYDKHFYNPSKQVFKLTTVAAEEIVRKGINDDRIINRTYRDKLALFIERILAFNTAIDRISQISTANPTLSEQLRFTLKNFGLFDPDITTTVFETNLKKDKKFNDPNNLEYLLCEQIFRQNKVIHQDLISNRAVQDRLNFLYFYLKKETKNIIDKLDRKVLLPWFIKYKLLNIIILIAFFIIYGLIFKV